MCLLGFGFSTAMGLLVSRGDTERLTAGFQRFKHASSTWLYRALDFSSKATNPKSSFLSTTALTVRLSLSVPNMLKHDQNPVQLSKSLSPITP
jgi:hypothetical protein